MRFFKRGFVIGLVSVFFFSGFSPSGVKASTSLMEGAWLGEWPSADKGNVQAFNQLTNSQTEVIHTFVNTDQPFYYYSGVMDYVDSQGAINLITIEPNGYTTTDINRKKLDRYFAALAKDMKNWQGGKEIWVRFMHEMNGNWYSWSIGDSKVNSDREYIKAYQRVVNIFRQNGADNVKWVYSVNNENVGKNTSFLGAYPGDDYIDFTAIDGYNWGTSQPWSQWKSFTEVFTPSYTELQKLNKPILLTEWASSEAGGDKGAWIKDAFYQMEQGNFDIKAAIWFNENKETDWRIDSSDSSLLGYLHR